MSEKTEKPTPKRIDKARKEGQVAVSKDLSKAATVAVLGELAFATESIWHEHIDLLIRLPTQRFGEPFRLVMAEMLAAAGTLLLVSFALLGIAGIAIAVASNWGQFGVLVSTKALTPKFDRLNPVQGMKNLFSKRKLLELIEALIKACMLGIVVYIFIRSQLPVIVGLANGTPRDSYAGFVALLHAAFRITVGISLVYALLDFALQKYLHQKSLYMSMDEIKREYKESEGDPMIKGKRRQLARQLANSGPVAKTARADAVVVNPTHFAVAMRYDDESTSVPVVLAKGKDNVAREMIAQARRLDIPVIRHVWLARMLYATGRDDEPVPRSSYAAVAHVYAVVRELGGVYRGPQIELDTSGAMPAD